MEEKTKAEDIFPIGVWLSDSFYREEHSNVDQFLIELNLDESVLYLVAVIRFTFPARSKLSNWIEARDNVYAEIKRRGENADRVLRGLY